MQSSCCAQTTDAEPSEAAVKQSEIGPLYDRLSKFYNLWGILAESRARQQAIRLAGIEDGQNILEVAVGTGLAFEKLVQLNPNGQNTGIDLSEGMLARAGKRMDRLSNANYRLEVGTAMDLQVPSESVDLLMNNYMFDLISIDEMDTVLKEFRRVLKNSGKLVMVNMTRSRTRCSGFYEWLYHRFPHAMGGCRGVEISPRLTQHGFKVQSREYITQFCFPSEVVVATKD